MVCISATIFLVCLGTLVQDTLSTATVKTSTVYGCEGTYAWLQCPTGKAIYVTKATYGRTTTDVCKHEKGLKKNCVQSDVQASLTTKKVKELCDNRRTCSVYAFNTLFDDPCKGTYKYVTVEYHCTDPECKNIFKDETCDDYAFGAWAKSKGSECVNNPTWMYKMCWKSCTNCNSECNNVAIDDAQCDQFALQGECIKNPNWMYVYCQQSCKACPEKTVCKNTLGDDNKCQKYAAAGECNTNALWMYRFCRKACGGCRKGCYNIYSNETKCDIYTQQGECETNPDWMLNMCTRSCGACPKTEEECVNKKSTLECDQRRRDGECSANVKWMLENCKKSCLCFRGDECLNAYRLDARCEEWAKQGECEHNAGWMIPNCRKSCGRCNTE